MRLSVHATGFDLAPEMRTVVERRVLRELRRYGDRIRSAVIRLEAGRGRGRPSDVYCSIAITLQEQSRRIDSHAADTRMQAAIDRAASEIGEKLEGELSRVDQRSRPGRRSRPRTRQDGPLPHDQKPWAAEYWKPPGADDTAPPGMAERRSRGPVQRRARGRGRL